MPEFTPEEAELRETILDWMELATVDQVLTAVKAHDKEVAARAWDEGALDGAWNEEHAGMIDSGLRQRIANPYRGDNR
jgi:hypothetical protein